ncbi:type II toxin-antitoxin system ParD family antitoxin [Singulisphaera acidiphila]|uniref:Putative addiction module antidote protein, CC2985 family n=1 Tax=Singulisphaera acidiphila (strain ATCC BAA-1392 / DSM 18658 / VKM B-2454 / MOB10) TaxID=886293 RepID=L0DE51_SINAD|nr:type II toxin-antitoxin system ParD family antitoxin [Singulisphaera acidiphila]AGA27527.1 putative addiction module antidote protein, CC2985 family [Singulisphaera acidiphila DSM 18658]
MTINLSVEREQFIRSLVQGGRYASENEVIEEALRLLELRDQKHAEDKERIEALLIEGLDSGPSTPMTTQDWDDIEREGKRILATRRDRMAQ